MKPRIKQRRPVAGRPLKVMMLGLRGLPRVQGGVERHVEELALRLARSGCSVEILARGPYVDRKEPHRWRGLVVTPLPSPRTKSLEAVVHTLVGVIHAARRGSDILHIHAVGPSLLVPFARALGLRVVVTHHGFDYDRAKWGRAAKVALKLGEWVGMRFADRRIAVSRVIAGTMLTRYGVIVNAVPNGVTPQPPPASTTALKQFGLTPRRYIVTVSRLVPEKRHFDLIEAFTQGAPDGWNLAIIGAADHEDDYSRMVLTAAKETPGIVATGFQSGLALRELMAHAGLFVLPSSHEGLPIALLEALSNGLPVIASDIPANREIGLAEDCYFPVGDIAALTAAITRSCALRRTEAQRDATRAQVGRDYDWDVISQETRAVYETIDHDADREAGARRLTPLPHPLP